MNAAEAVAPDPPKTDRLRRIRRTVLELTLFAAVFYAVTGYQERNLLARHTEAPGFSLSSLDGKQVSLESFRGKRVLLHFWATWCGVCRQEFSALNSVAERLGPEEALVTVVADADDRARLQAFVEQEHIRYPVLLGDESVVRDYRVGMFPTNYYLDENGRISSRTVGMSTRWSFLGRLWLAR